MKIISILSLTFLLISCEKAADNNGKQGNNDSIVTDGQYFICDGSQTHNFCYELTDEDWTLDKAQEFCQEITPVPNAKCPAQNIVATCKNAISPDDNNPFPMLDINYYSTADLCVNKGSCGLMSGTFSGPADLTCPPATGYHCNWNQVTCLDFLDGNMPKTAAEDLCGEPLVSGSCASGMTSYEDRAEGIYSIRINYYN